MSSWKILFVCLGNICRSPMAEAVFRARCKQAGRLVSFVVDSAGTGDWHVGEPPDARAISVAARRGYDLSGLRARQVVPADFAAFDHVVAMDRRNLASLNAMVPVAGRAKLSLFSAWISGDGFPDEVPDPYYGGAQGFERVLDMIEAGCDGLLELMEPES